MDRSRCDVKRLMNLQWGDAPIHSLAAGALLSVKDVHYFRDFGYRHTTIQHCPANAPARQLPRPGFPEPPAWAHAPLGGIYSNEKGKNIWDEEKKWREEEQYWDDYDKERENGVGCRCHCDTDIVDVEGKEGSCLVEWVDVAGGWSSP
jgi:mannosyltransferase